MSPSAREYLQYIFDETTYIMMSSTSLDKTKFVQDEKTFITSYPAR
jgi:hypothetical protein